MVQQKSSSCWRLLVDSGNRLHDDREGLPRGDEHSYQWIEAKGEGGLDPYIKGIGEPLPRSKSHKKWECEPNQCRSGSSEVPGEPSVEVVDVFEARKSVGSPTRHNRESHRARVHFGGRASGEGQAGTGLSQVPASTSRTTGSRPAIPSGRERQRLEKAVVVDVVGVP